jgi:hypothetical protein
MPQPAEPSLAIYIFNQRSHIGLSQETAPVFDDLEIGPVTMLVDLIFTPLFLYPTAFAWLLGVFTVTTAPILEESKRDTAINCKAEINLASFVISNSHPLLKINGLELQNGQPGPRLCIYLKFLFNLLLWFCFRVRNNH